MNQELNLCMVTAKERKRRKLIYLPSRYARDYFSYCEEAGCEWEGFLNSIVEKMEPAALLELPDSLVTPGFSKTAAGVEGPLDYEKELPQPYQIAELPECIMLYFQGEPYEREEDFCQAINSVSMAIKKYNPALYGYRFAYDAAPQGGAFRLQRIGQECLYHAKINGLKKDGRLFCRPVLFFR